MYTINKLIGALIDLKFKPHNCPSCNAYLDSEKTHSLCIDNEFSIIAKCHVCGRGFYFNLLEQEKPFEQTTEV